MAEHHVQLATKDTLFYVKYSDEAIWHERFTLANTTLRAAVKQGMWSLLLMAMFT